MTNTKDKIELRRSRVRMVTTYAAVAFLFGGGALLIALLMGIGKHKEAADLFLTVLPIASGIIAYWFGTRRINSDDQKPLQVTPRSGANVDSATQPPAP